MQAIQYRTGINRHTGETMIGFPVIAQALSVIWLTRLGSRIMRLNVGSNLHRHLAEDISPRLVLQIYDDLVKAAHAFEPEFRIHSLQLVRLTATGALGLTFTGTYYPHGRFNDYSTGARRVSVAPSPVASLEIYEEAA